MQIIHIHADAPLKPALGAACNGCGVCCLAEPCPVGVVVSRRWRGPCRALQWDEHAQRYHCGLLGSGPPTWFARIARRLISAGSGCDSDGQIA